MADEQSNRFDLAVAQRLADACRRVEALRRDLKEAEAQLEALIAQERQA